MCVIQCDEKLLDNQSFVENIDTEELVEVQFNTPPAKVYIMPKAKCKTPMKNPTKTQLKRTEKTIRKIEHRKYIKKLYGKIDDNQFFMDYYTDKIDNCGSLSKTEIKNLIIFINLAKPINRSTLKAINKVNIFNRRFAEQFLAVDGSRVRLPGSKGADWKELSYSIQHPKLSRKCDNRLNETLKKYLGNVKRVKHPPIGLTISSQIETFADTCIYNYLKSIKDPSGLIDQSAKDERQLSEFDLYSNVEFLDSYRGKDDIDNSVICVMRDVLRSVAISSMQDFYALKDPDNDYEKGNEHIVSNKSTYVKNSMVIDNEEHSQNTNTECGEDSCNLGCVCSSLKNNYLLSEHCRLTECMLKCKCDIYKKEKSDALKTKLKVLLPRIPKKIDFEPWCMVHGLYRCFCKNKNVLGDLEYNSMYYNKKPCSKIAPIPLEQTKNDATVPNLKKRKINKTVTITNQKNNGIDSQSKTKIQSMCAEKNTPPAKNPKKKSLVYLKDPWIDKKIVDAIIQTKSFKVPKEAKYVSFLYTPKNESVVISWCALLGNFSLGKIFIWLSTERPYIPNVTLNKQASFPYKSVLITESDATLREFYPQFVSDIHNKVILDNTFIVLVGKKYAWRMNNIFCFNLKKNSDVILRNNNIKSSAYVSNKCIVSVDEPVTADECHVNLQNSPVLQHKVSVKKNQQKGKLKKINKRKSKSNENSITKTLTIKQSLLKNNNTNNNLKKLTNKPESNNISNSLASLENRMIFNEDISSSYSTYEISRASSLNSTVSLPIKPPENVQISHTQNIITPSVNCILEKNTNISNSQTSNINTKRWYQVNFCDDFGYVTVESKVFRVEYDNVIEGMKISLETNQICRMLTPDKSFGLYALPIVQEKSVFLGPYYMGEDHNIVFKEGSDKIISFWLLPDCLNNTVTLDLLNTTALDTYKKNVVLNSIYPTVTRRYVTSQHDRAIERMKDSNMATSTEQNVSVHSDIYGPSTSKTPDVSENNYLPSVSTYKSYDNDDVEIINKEKNTYEIIDSE